MKKIAFLKKCLLAVGATGGCLSFLLLTTSTSAFPTVTATAQCGPDSYVDCWGGVRCVAIDDRYCKCFGAKGQVVSYHSCSEAAQRDVQAEK